METVHIECRSWYAMDGARAREAWVVRPGGEAKRPVAVRVFDVLLREGAAIVDRWNIPGDGATTIEVTVDRLRAVEQA